KPQGGLELAFVFSLAVTRQGIDDGVTEQSACSTLAEFLTHPSLAAGDRGVIPHRSLQSLLNLAQARSIWSLGMRRPPSTRLRMLRASEKLPCLASSRAAARRSCEFIWFPFSSAWRRTIHRTWRDTRGPGRPGRRARAG